MNTHVALKVLTSVIDNLSSHRRPESLFLYIHTRKLGRLSVRTIYASDRVATSIRWRP